MASAITSSKDDLVNSRMALVAIVAAGTVGEVLLYIVPILLGAVVESFEIREGTAGLVMSLEIAVSAGAALIFTSVVHRVPIRQFVILGVFVIFLGDFASAFLPSFSLFVAARVVAALGAGAVFAAANTMAAQRENPEKTFAILSFSVIVAATVGYIAITTAIQNFGPQSSFAALALLSLLALPFLIWFPNQLQHEAEAPSLKLGASRRLPAIAALAAIFILFIGQNGLWAYAERIGASLEIPLATISQVLILNGIISLSGPVFAHWLNIRFGRRVPIILAFSVQIVMSLALVYASSFTTYASALIILNTAFMFSIPYLKGIMAAIDPSGRVAGASAAFITIGAALGPGIAGIGLNAGATYVAIGWFAALATALTAMLATAITFAIGKGMTFDAKRDQSFDAG